MTNLNKLKLRILELSFKHKLSHIGSCLTALPIIYDEYLYRPEKFRFILSAGHAGLALYVVLEHFGIVDTAERLLTEDGIHPVRLGRLGIIDCSTGSLGLGATIAVGIATALPVHQVTCLCSDGEALEGAIWESLRYAKLSNFTNLYFKFNINGYGALGKTDPEYLNKVLHAMHDGIHIYNTANWLDEFPFLKGLDAHYYVMNEADWKLAQEILTK